MDLKAAMTALTAAADAGDILSTAGLTILIGLTVVFSVLILLTAIFWLFGKAMGAGKAGKKERVSPDAQQPAAKPVTVSAPAPASVPAAPVAADTVAPPTATQNARTKPPKISYRLLEATFRPEKAKAIVPTISKI